MINVFFPLTAVGTVFVLVQPYLAQINIGLSLLQ